MIINKLYIVKRNIIRTYNITNTCIKSISKKLALKFMKWWLISAVFMQKFPIATMMNLLLSHLTVNNTLMWMFQNMKRASITECVKSFTYQIYSRYARNRNLKIGIKLDNTYSDILCSLIQLVAALSDL
jgi:hypothetical protein